MINPALIAKAAVTILSDKKHKKRVGWIIGIILSPFILIIVILCGLLSGGANLNKSSVDIVFNDSAIPENAPDEYTAGIEKMSNNFNTLNEIISSVNAKTENEESLDSIRVKAIFYALYFAEDCTDYTKFVDCFVTYEQRTKTISNPDGTTSQVTYTVALPIKELSQIYENIASVMGIDITCADKANATEIYYRIIYRGPAPTYGDEFDDFTNGPFIGADGFCCPIGENWRNVVTSEFGYRLDPITGEQKFHGGIDLGMPKGTPIHCALDGTVMLVRYSTTGYGYHIMVDHGGEVVTLYAHCCEIDVTEGQKVKAGQEIAKVGTTGRSTGNHLHFEVRVNGEKQNPRDYLP